jgi:hypothetical protein
MLLDNEQEARNFRSHLSFNKYEQILNGKDSELFLLESEF